MTYSNKSIFVVVILVSYIAVVFTTDPNIGNNVCNQSQKKTFDGTQNPDGECVTTVMGEIPDVNKMASTVIRFPQNNDVLNENEPFTIRTKTVNIITGFFDDPVKQYYLFPQTLDDNGFIQGHSHVTIQKIETPDEPPDARVFAFFKGLNDPADGNGELAAAVDKGLTAGDYRLCTIVSSFAHQPLLMPVAQRGRLPVFDVKFYKFINIFFFRRWSR